MTLKTRKPTGKPAWPIVLLAGREKAGKTYAAAQASSSNLIDRTFWIGLGEDDPDEYAPLGRFEIVEHEGTYQSVAEALDEIVAMKPGKGGRPHMIVLDSLSMLWSMLTDEAQQLANVRAARKARKYGRPEPSDDAPIGMDLWNRAAKRWRRVMDLLRAHSGPVLATARLAEVAVLDSKGDPTGEKTWKIEGHKTLPFDATVIVQMRARHDVYLTAVRSLAWAADPEAEVKVNDFTVADLWQKLGITGATDRSHVPADGQASIAAEQAMRDSLINRLAAVTDVARMDEWWQSRHGESIHAASDLAALNALVVEGEQRAAASKDAAEIVDEPTRSKRADESFELNYNPLAEQDVV